jgi:hypothetical protein
MSSAFAKRGISSVYLIVDSRERAVIPFIETVLQEHAYIAKQVTTGDYLICRSGEIPKILACVERKTLVDFAASFKDGRVENIRKMRALRAATGCALYYFIEGPAFPSPARRFARIPYGNILAAMTKLMVRDGVFIVQTADERHTATRLNELMHTYASVTEPHVEIRAGDSDGDGDIDGDGGDNEPLAVPDVLTIRHEETELDAAVNMWSRLRGISIVLGKIITREFTVAALATGKVSCAQIRALKTATGRGINKDAVASLLAIQADEFGHGVKLISGLRNITPATATIILTASGGLRGLCEGIPAATAGVELPQKNRTIKLGNARADRIHRMLHWRDADVGDAILPDNEVEDILAASGFA